MAGFHGHGSDAAPRSARSPDLKPIVRASGYLPIEDHGLVGDGATAALIGRDGGVSWLCAPRFDSAPVFAGILDAATGGAFTVTPEELVEAAQQYEDGTGVVVTSMRTRTGLVRVIDALPLRAGADLLSGEPAGCGDLFRLVVADAGRVRVRVAVEPRGGATATRSEGHLRLACPARPDLDLRLYARPMLGRLPDVVTLEAGDRLALVLRWGAGLCPHTAGDADELGATLAAWRRWAAGITYEGPRPAMVRRSAITLKLLQFLETGAMVAAPTSSLPERLGGPRNWDYRFAWVRDAAFSVYALHRIGLSSEARRFLEWVLDAAERDGHPRVLYTLDGVAPPPERLDPDLEGYRRSPPVRWGNAAAEQSQHDVYGEIIDCAYQWAHHHGQIAPALWKRLRALAETAAVRCGEPDHGLWEVRTAPRSFTYSAALCQVALDRAARMAARYGLPGDVAGWRDTADRIRQGILRKAWDAETGVLTQHLTGGAVDASLLALPLRRVVPPDHPRMIATTDAIVERLGAGDGLLYRYLPEESPDGLAGEEGAFLLCSFWLVDNLCGQGRLDEAMKLYDSLCDRANALGLLAEEIDPTTGAFLGNFPQALSHVGLISSGVNLWLATDARR